MTGIKEQFLLDPQVVYLNHGSFGACPRPIFENYQSWQRALEFEPVQFITRKRNEAILVSKKILVAKYHLWFDRWGGRITFSDGFCNCFRS